MLKLINQPVDQAAIKWPQLPPFNHAKQGCFYFTHYWPLIFGSRSKPRTLQVAAVRSSIVGAPTRNVGRPINPLELWSPILPSSLKLSLKPTSAPLGSPPLVTIQVACPSSVSGPKDAWGQQLDNLWFLLTLFQPLWIHARYLLLSHIWLNYLFLWPQCVCTRNTYWKWESGWYSLLICR